MVLLEKQLIKKQLFLMPFNSDLSPLPLNSSICLISARRYGDAIMNARLAKSAAQSRPDLKWVIWTKPEFAPLFRLMGFDQIIASQFPIAGGAPTFLKEYGNSLIKAIFQLRNLNLSASLDFIGDSREALCGSLITGSNHYSPAWEKSHWMHRLIWNLKIPCVKYLPIQATQDQVYDIVASLLSKLTGKPIALAGKSFTFNYHPKIAFHPFSSQAFKAWPENNWQQLNQLLNKESLIPAVFCTESENAKAHHIFSSGQPQIAIKATASLDELIDEIQSVDILVGVDSFLVHLASALGKKTIVLNTGNNPKWWQPPNSIALGQSGGCIQYPCSNEPSCLGKPNESQCIKSIHPSEVMTSIHSLLAEAVSQ